jgi:hypothetical protein
MAIGLRIKFAGATQQQYDALHGALNVDNVPPEGLIFHSAGPIDGGWGVIDFWESREAFDHFVQTQLGPTAQGLGDKAPSSPPDIKEFPVYHVTKP